MRDLRGRRILQALPKTEWPELEALRERHEQLQAHSVETGRKLEQLRAEHAKADEQHRADYAAAGVAKRPRPFHDLRHTAITNDAAAGSSPIAVMAKAGHANMSTTQRYVHLAGVVFPRRG